MIIDNEHKVHVFRKFDIEAVYQIAICSLNKGISNDIIEIDQSVLIDEHYKLS
ncbi:hypothetical protein [Clostridium estertheticum]|uniref:hypothetical protein n=1 Tax=Clostridium estertheticum TaxID=238834 RepID=UPI001C6E9A81|nr:hypothetical protein [Clostridium estertheticum]MBW9153915.1 hypothetical protein [Clostridium estertheticum]WLC86529.1 hypothetical protein KTC97_20555 [Clostridium estertheticum]